MKRYLVLSIVLWVGIASAFAEKEVHIISANDMHANLQKMPHLGAIVDSIRGRYPSVIVLSAGDNHTGEPVNDMYSIPGYPMVALMNQIGFTATTLGNHEFDGGGKNLGQLIGLSNFSYLCCNLEPAPELGIFTRPYRMFDVGGAKIGIIGVTELGGGGIPSTHPNNCQGLTFSPIKQSVERYKWLRDSCDVVILLSHIGFEDDVALSKDMPWIDLIVGGHTHTQLSPSEAPYGVTITQNVNRLERVTHTTLILDDCNKLNKIKSENIEVNNYPKHNETLQLLVDHFCNSPEFQRVIGQIEVPITNCEEFGCMMAEAYRTQGGGDIGIVNYGGVRLETFAAGPFTVKDALSLDPFQNDAVEINLTGEELRQLLISCSAADRDRFPFSDGVLCKPVRDNKGTRVKDVKLYTPDGKKLNLKKTYKVITNSYIPVIITSEHKDPGRALNYQTAQMIIDFVQAKGTLNYHGAHSIIAGK